jgi:biofilm PGA synthesis N-glycosyltransferase PgaC
MAFIIIISLYAILILLLVIGFSRLKEYPEETTVVNFISVVIAVRDEPNLTELLNDLSGQQYSSYEVIVVDDHSTTSPGTQALINKGQGKKAAITTGIASAKGNIIVTTDGDCRVRPQWLSEINKGFQDASIKMLVGGVRIEGERSFFSKLQALEFVSVAVTSAATIGLGFPTMCNGANLAYRKDAFHKVNGFEGNERISSGDDEFLMNKFDKRSIQYLKSTASLVTSSPLPLVTSFINQRLRWAGKWSVNTSLVTKLFAVIVFGFHLFFVVTLIGFFSLKISLIILLTKALVETMLLYPAARFFDVKWRWIPFLALQLVYSAYVISIGLLSQVVLPKWKGRAVETKV